LAKIACGNFRGVESVSQSTRPAKSVVFAGVPTLGGNFRRGEALSQSIRPAKNGVFAGVPIVSAPVSR
jgi:hypothetical protein